jgi:hypothetical protein
MTAPIIRREERIAIVKVSQTNAVPLGCSVWCGSSGLVFACGCTDPRPLARPCYAKSGAVDKRSGGGSGNP